MGVITYTEVFSSHLVSLNKHRKGIQKWNEHEDVVAVSIISPM